MRQDAFSKCHPAVNFLFFVAAIGLGAVIQHPLYLAAAALCGSTYYLLLNGKKGWKTVLATLPLFAFLTLINPLFNTDGQTVLFWLFERPYTLEALYYGGAGAAAFVNMLLWFGCYNKVLTGDKFTALFGNLIPAVSMLLVMVLRLVPALMRKIRQITDARKCIGKGSGENTRKREKLADGAAVLGTLTTWVLEGSIVTGDSMRARGYGAAKRSSFMIYRMTRTDVGLLAGMLLLIAAVIAAAVSGQTAAAFTPRYEAAPASFGVLFYTAFLLIPTVLHVKEAAQWHSSISKI